jgi:hypothetical protein
VRIIPSPVSLEELSRFWSGFFHTPYTLSMMYEASAVILSSALVPTVAPPVHQPPSPTAAKGLPPALGPLPTVDYSPGRIVPVSGQGVQAGQYIGLMAEWTRIESAIGGGLGFLLPAGLSAGPMIATLGEDAVGGPAAIPGSPQQTLRVRPKVSSIVSTRDDRDALVVTLDVDPPADQDLVLSLISLEPPTGSSLESVLLSATPRAPTSTFTFRPPALSKGRYLAIVEVGGVSSLPVYKKGRYTAPALKIR